MADRTSARLFGRLFTMLDDGRVTTKEDMIKVLWELQQRYDFHPCQMECNEALIRLGLAKKVEEDIHYLGDE